MWTAAATDALIGFTLSNCGRLPPSPVVIGSGTIWSEGAVSIRNLGSVPVAAGLLRSPAALEASPTAVVRILYEPYPGVFWRCRALRAALAVPYRAWDSDNLIDAAARMTDMIRATLPTEAHPDADGDHPRQEVRSPVVDEIVLVPAQDVKRSASSRDAALIEVCPARRRGATRRRRGVISFPPASSRVMPTRSYVRARRLDWWARRLAGAPGVRKPRCFNAPWRKGSRSAARRPSPRPADP